MAKIPEEYYWDHVMGTVEGRSGAVKTTIKNNNFHKYQNGGFVNKDTTLRKDIISDILRSEKELPQYVRNWLADMFDDNADSIVKVKLNYRNRSRPKSANVSKDLDAAQFFYDAIQSGEKYLVAKKECAQNFGISETHAGKLYSLYKEALEIALED